MTTAGLAPIAVTMGEPGGIAPEVFAKAFLDPRIGGVLPLVYCGAPEVIGSAFAALKADVELTAFAAGGAAERRRLAVAPVALGAEAQAGWANPACGAAIIEAIRSAVAMAADGTASAVVTGPVQKKSLQDAGYDFPGHTEVIAAQLGVAHPVMMLAVPELRVVPVTVHLPLKDVSAKLTRNLIVETGHIVAAALKRDFGIAAPRLAVAGLNPHAGEGGAMGLEEREVIAPAAAALAASGVNVFGPAPADTLFHAEARGRYDAVLCMYHDQALIPLKTLDFWNGVNATLGLPLVRTSPDHGTGLDIAGRNRADARSMIAALLMAAQLADKRRST